MFNGKFLEITESYKYLGLVINTISRQNGNLFREMQKYTADKALRACFVAMNKCKSLGRVTPKINLQMFDSFVLPVLEYACEIWSDGKEKDCLERIQLRYLKRLLMVKDSTSSVAVYAETGRTKLIIRQKIRSVKFWFRLELMQNCKLVKKAYLSLKDLDNAGYLTWISNIRNILKENGLYHYFINSCTLSKFDEIECIKLLKGLLHKKFEDTCMLQLGQMPSLRTYVKFKLNFGLESYLLLIKDHKLRKCMSKFRLSSHELNIEKGRHTKPKTKLEDRLCTLCDLFEVEDELHLLMYCKSYELERMMLFEKISGTIPLTDDKECLFTKLMSCTEENVIFSLCKFLVKCFKTRKLQL